VKVKLAVFGGFASGINRPVKELDTARLPEDDASELQCLLEVARSALASETSELTRDAQSYCIEVDDGATTMRLEAEDGSMPPQFRALLNRIRELLRSGAG
jgi:hypothetical protein